MSIITVNSITEATELPQDENGSPWPFILIREDTAYLAHSRTELVGALIDGYEDIPHTSAGDEEALLARIDVAVEVASALQGAASAFATNESGVNFEEFPELAELVFTPKEVALDIEGGYQYDLPLYVVTSTYDAAKKNVPEGESVIVIDPSDETTLLSSLAATGICSLLVASEVPESDGGALDDDAGTEFAA